MARKARPGRHEGMSRTRAGVLAVVVLLALSYFGFTKANPFANPFELTASFQTANNLKPNSPVRIAGVDVGKVSKVEPNDDGPGAVVTMELKEKALPLHSDAQMKVRPRVFLEGNFFIDVNPGSPSAPTVDDGDEIPSSQTAAPVQLGDVLTTLQSDTREDLQTLLREYSQGLKNGGAQGFNESIKYWSDAYRNAAIVNQATLGTDPTKDIQRVLNGQQKTFAALASNEEALKSLVTDFNTTAGALAREDDALAASIPALDQTLKIGQPALASLNDALPTLRVFSREALPGVRSSDPTLKASIPFIRQLRGLVQPDELQGAARELRRQAPNFVGLNRTSVPLLVQGRALSRCTSRVLVPFINTPMPVPDPELKGLNGLTVNEMIQHGLVGLAGESRNSDGNNSFFHVSAQPPPLKVRPAAPPDGGHMPPPHRPDVPCETQEAPNMNSPGGNVAQFLNKGERAPERIDVRKLLSSLREVTKLVEKSAPEFEKRADRLRRDKNRQRELVRALRQEARK